MSVSIFKMTAEMADMDQGREPANWLAHYIGSDDNTRFFVDQERLDDAVESAEGDIKDGKVPRDFADFHESFKLKDLKELTKRIKEQVTDMIKANKGDGVDLEVGW